MSEISLLVGAATILTLSGCIELESYETAPVSVSTPQGVVTCQLYTANRVLWDEAIRVPKGMSINTGDAICRAEGSRRKGRSGLPKS